MPITKQDVEKVADLAKIRLDESEKERFVEQLNEILKYVDKINELDLTDVPESHGMADLQNVMREDIVKPWLTQEEALMNAPARHGEFFSVPKVIRQDKRK